MKRLLSVPVPVVLALCGSIYFAAILVLIVSEAPLGSPSFFSVAAVMTAAYAAMLARVWSAPLAGRRLLMAAFAFALLFRIPPALARVGPDSDMVRYLWDGRVQQSGYNPYRVLPTDPALAGIHTDETAAMPSKRHRTPYQPAAQLFFRLVVAAGNSLLAMKLALVACDLLTIAVLWRWLALTRRNEWLTLAYAWHPLVVFEVAHSGHVDALGTLWVLTSAYWLTRGRTALASVAFVLAVATKPLPIVLAPLFAARIRWRDLLLAGAFGVMLYLPFTLPRELPLGSVPSFVATFRFNGPVFKMVAAGASPVLAAGLALLAGLAVATYLRFRLPADSPAAWAWPMAVALAAAPVVYPWYLLYLTPFLFAAATVPLTAWTISIIPVYVVWQLAREGGRWMVPPVVLVLEYGVLLAACLALVAWRRRQRRSTGLPAASHAS